MYDMDRGVLGVACYSVAGGSARRGFCGAKMDRQCQKSHLRTSVTETSTTWQVVFVFRQRVKHDER